MSKFKLDPKLIADILLFVGASFTSYYMLSYAMSMMNEENKGESKKKANVVMQRLLNRRPDLDITIDRYDQLILSSVIMPEDIKTGFEGAFLFYFILFMLGWFFLLLTIPQILEDLRTLLKSCGKAFYIH